MRGEDGSWSGISVELWPAPARGLRTCPAFLRTDQRNAAVRDDAFFDRSTACVQLEADGWPLRGRRFCFDVMIS